MKLYLNQSRHRSVLVLLVILAIVGILSIVGLLTRWYLKSTVDRSVLTDSPCAAPCWEGVVPGTAMDEDEVLELLKELPSVGRVWKNRSIMWHWKEWPWEGQSYNSIFLMGTVVNNITLYFAFDLTVEEIVDKYGIPETVSVTQVGIPYAHIAVHFFYPTRGLTFKAEVFPDYDPVLKPTTRVSKAVYTAPVDSFEDWQDSFPDLHLQPWPGYGKLEEVFDPHNP